MNNFRPLIAITFLLIVSTSSWAAVNDSLLSTKRQIRYANALLDTDPDIIQYGFKLGTDLSLTSRQLSDYDHLNGLLSGTFGFYFRAGYEFIFGEIGLSYMFFKGRYDAYTPDGGTLLGTETVESRYLQIPLKVVGQISLGKKFAFLPNAGFLYQPLIQNSKNDINYGKNNLTAHQFLFTAGMGIRIKFLTFDVTFKQSLKPFFADRPSIKPSFLNLMVGFHF
jgi:hypothetical protein